MFTFRLATGEAGEVGRERSITADARTATARTHGVTMRSCMRTSGRGTAGEAIVPLLEDGGKEGNSVSGGGGTLRFHLGQAFLALTSEVRNDADLALNEHELSAMMHFVLFGAEDAFQTGLGRFSVRFSDTLSENFWC